MLLAPLDPDYVYGHSSFREISTDMYDVELMEYEATTDTHDRRPNYASDTVKFAGTLEWERGRGLVSWTNDSGHYMPTPKDAKSTGLDMRRFRAFDEDKLFAELEGTPSNATGRGRATHGYRAFVKAVYPRVRHLPNRDRFSAIAAEWRRLKGR